MTFRGVMGRRVAELAVQHASLAAAQHWITSIDDPASRAWAELGAGEGLSKSNQSLGISSPTIMIGFGN